MQSLPGKKHARELGAVEGIGRKAVADIGNPDYLRFAEKEIKFCERDNITIKLRHLRDLPPLLNECDDAPAILYQKGEIDNTLKTVSIVGTRNMTPYGKSFIHTFFEETQSCRYSSVSGLALGVDKEVHEQSLNINIPTVAVLAHGFHTLYPFRNRRLSERILDHGGALLTEFNSSRKPDRENFIQRNRIIAGLSPATVVVETAFGGGSVSTATFANQYNRDVFALPGKITDPYSQGCNHLIFQHKASVISTTKELIEQLGLNGSREHMEELFPYSAIHVQLNEIQELIYQCIKENQQISLDDMAASTELPPYRILPVILELELLGKIKTLSGRQFTAI
ncbi:DNA-processing protein DprA [Chryseobacterium camelliae]|uniref:DNA processing protein n=1 Tax=Chryseobacterium camelliae TaxID=1265445 RepID=A0ABU0TPA8_9FLAO|nr:DNA-processing protein DprA [Chryseobacterium camelliae]MDQ1098103.1 DNA processing protein [Chryseobacterium camelliae]